MNGATRQKIIMAAMELFLEKGYGSTSIADILSRSQAHSGSLYQFFPGKQDVLVAVLEFYRDGIDENLLAYAWEGVEDPIEKIFALLDGYRVHLLTSDYMFGCPIGDLALELHDADPKVRELLDINFRNWTDAVESCLVAAGERLPEDLDRRALAEFILTIMEGALMQAKTARDISRFDRNVDVLRSHLDLLQQQRAAA